MADNTQVNVPSSSGDLIRTEDVGGGVKTQVVKLDMGAAGADGPIVSAASPLPVVQTGTPALPTGAATLAEQQTQTTALQLLDNAVSGSGFNITQFAGTGAQTGSGTATGALRVELPTNGTGVIATVTAVTAITNALPAGNNNIGDVDIASSALPTGAATLAEQQTQTTALGSILTAVQIMDDWDESDRAKVNPIVGQAGVAGGTGVDGATVQRVSLATNVALPAGNNNIGDVDVASSALPTGASTLAEQQAQTAILTTIDGDTGTLAGTVTSARVAVNPIVGSAGVTGNTGTVDATTQRVVLATNVGLPAGTSNIGDVDVLTLPPQRYAQVFGTAQTLFDSATDIAGGAFSGAGTAFDNTSDAAIPLAPYVEIMIEMPDWAAAPVAGTVVQVWGLLINVDGSDDDTDAPTAAASGGAILLVSFPIAAADSLQRRTRIASLAGIQSGFTPYVFNGTAQNMNNDGGTNMVVKATPVTYRTAT